MEPRVRILPAGHVCLSLVNVLCCLVELSATGRSLIQRSPTDCGVSEFDLETSTMRRRRLTRAAKPWKPPNWHFIWRPRDVALISITFVCNLLPSALFSDSWTFRIGPTGYHETSVRNCRYSLRNHAEERNFHLLPSTDKNSFDLDIMGRITYLPANLAGKTYI